MATPNLPLHCSICPKKPDFSDVSHLLTHIASKGHLSHYYKIKVRSGNDDISRDLIEIYDQWYSDWNVEGLMSDRLNLKDRKRLKAHGLPSVLRPSKKPQRRKEQQVDPRLSGAVFKQANNVMISPTTIRPRPVTPPVMYSSPIAPPRKIHRARLHLWSTRRPTSVDAIPLEFSSPIPSSPTALFTHFSHQAPLAQMFCKTDVEVDVDEEVGTSATKLKGVLWPGMNIFDAATPDMRRRRNQKKETSVVTRLERNASVVEANEMIFTPTGSLWKQRPISGHVDFDSSPYKISHPSPPPKRKASSRIPLGDRDTNSTMLPPQRTSISRRTFNYGPVKNVEAKHDIDPKPAKKKKRNFQVLNENNTPAIADTPDLKFLTSEFHYGQLPGYEPAERPQRSLEGPMAALYRPAFQHNYFAEAFETYHTPVYAVPYYGYYGHATYDMPGFFSYPSQLPTQQEPGNDNGLLNENILDDTHTVSAASDE